MIKLRLYEGFPSENILESIPIAMEEAKQENETVYLLWNDVLVRVNPNDTSVEDIYKKYLELFKVEGVYSKYKRGELISVRDLGEKIAMFIKNM